MTSSDRPKPKNVPSPNDGRDPHSRFIPREELKGFASWQPGSIGGGPAPQSNVHRRVEEPRVDVAEQIAAQMRATRQAGYQDGYRDGLVALDGFKQSYAAQITAEVGLLTGTIGLQIDDLHQDMARALAVTATNLARQVVRSELATRPELIAQVAEETVDAIGHAARHLTLRVHPQDHGLVAQGAGLQIANGQLRLVADHTLTRGGCLLESEVGVIDATLEARWERALTSVGVEADWHAAPAPDTNADPDAAFDHPDLP